MAFPELFHPLLTISLPALPTLSRSTHFPVGIVYLLETHDTERETERIF